MMAKFATFDAISKLAYNLFPLASESVSQSLAISLISGMVAGVVASFLSQPSDTILVEVNDSTEGGVDIMGTVKSVFKEGGISAFYKGVVPRALKSAVNIALQFFLYDFMKRIANVGPEDLKVFFDVMSGVEFSAKSAALDLAPDMASLLNSLR
ncbi:unnamed protein product [Discosporangium mesarthrocarpum]